MELDPGLNVFVGRNAQGKTSLLEAVGLLARGRSFRTDDTPTLIRRGSAALLTRTTTAGEARETRLEVELTPGLRSLRVDGREVAPRDYQGRLEVVVYSTERLRVVRGSMRERRLFLDRGARLRARRAAYVDRLRRAMDARTGFRPAAEIYDLRLPAELDATSEEAQRETLARAVEGVRLREAHA